jgi:hypothetical protein
MIRTLLQISVFLFAIGTCAFLTPVIIVGTILAPFIFAWVFVLFMVFTLLFHYIGGGHIIHYDSYLRRFISFVDMGDYFGTYIEYPDQWKAMNGKQHMIISHPHGAYCFGALSGLHLNTHVQKNQRTIIMSAPLMFWIPVFGWLFNRCGCCAINETNIQSVLNHGKYSPIIIVGGVPEVVCMEDQHHERIYLNHRWGFIRIALETGTPIIPTYTFGETSMYNLWSLPLHSIRIWLSSRLNIPLVFPWFFGWYGSPMPKHTNLRVVVGNPINIPMIKIPSRDIIGKYKEKYIIELKRIYNGSCHDSRTLVII